MAQSQDLSRLWQQLHGWNKKNAAKSNSFWRRISLRWFKFPRQRLIFSKHISSITPLARKYFGAFQLIFLEISGPLPHHSYSLQQEIFTSGSWNGFCFKVKVEIDSLKKPNRLQHNTITLEQIMETKNSPVATVQRMFDAFKAGSMNALLDTIHQESQWTYVGANPQMSKAVFVGKEGVKKFFDGIRENLRIAEFNPKEFITQNEMEEYNIQVDKQRSRDNYSATRDPIFRFSPDRFRKMQRVV